jgi:hypothetical protein
VVEGCQRGRSDARMGNRQALGGGLWKNVSGAQCPVPFRPMPLQYVVGARPRRRCDAERRYCCFCCYCVPLATRNSQPATAPWHARDYGQFGTGGCVSQMDPATEAASKSRLEIRYGTMGSWSSPPHPPSSSTLPSCSRGQLSGCWPCTASVRPPEAYHIRGVLPRRAGPPALPLSLASCAVSLIGERLD